MADDKKKKKSLPRAYDEDTKERTGGKAAEATERAAQRRKEWEAKTRESTERARALTKQMTGYNSQGKAFGTKAGTKEPAFGVEASRPQSTAKSGLDALSSATSFEEYARKRREQEKEQGMKSAAARLAERNAAVNRAALPEAQEIDYAKAAEGLRGESGYGWKRVGNQVVFATPNSPLPKPTVQNTATPAQAPGLYGIKPVDYARDMSAIDSYRNRDRETQAFLDKYFGGSIPNDEQFVGTYRELVKNGQLTEDEMMKFHASADMVQKAAEQKQAYDAAIGRLGEDAEKYATGREADYYERYGDAFNAEELAGDEPLQYSGYGSKDGISLEEAKKYTNSPYAAQGRDRYGLQRWSQTTPQEREAYQMMLNLYGQNAADEYMKSLQGELNQRLAGATAQEAASYAQEHPVLASMRTVLNAPVQGAGMLEMGVEKLFGRDVDLYDPRLNLSRETEATRGTVAQNLGGVGGFLYNTGMSMVDNLANMAVYGGLGSIATTISMGAGSAASAFNSAVERGASENQAMGAAALSGIAEALFEKVSLDNVITLARGGGLKTVVGNIAKQSGIEASEELFTGIANEIGDRLIMGGLSNYELAMAEYMRNGMSEAEAKKQAAMDAAKEIGLGALGGALSGGLMGAGGQATAALTGANRTQQQVPASQQPAMPSVPAMPSAPAMPAQIGTSAMNANTQRMLAEAARQRAEAEQAGTDEREQLMKEYQPEEPSVEPEEPVQPAQEREDMPSAAQVEQQQAETAEPEQEEAQENKPEETASEGENGQMLKTQRTATVRGEDGEEKQVNVVGVMMDEGTPIMITRNEQGETDYTLASEMSFDTDETELLGYEGIERMDAKGLRNYLDNYDASKGTAKEYADAYNTVFKRASAGLDYQQAVMENETARTYMTEDARMSAYAAGLNAYNQTHETVQPAAVETTQATEAPAYAAMSAKEGGRGGRISRRYTQAAFGKLSKEGKQNAVAQMELLNAIASRTGRTITIVDSIVGKGGGHANALYNPETGEIRIALDATGGAYTYAAMHELTHAMKQEHAGEWKSFAGFVKETLKNNKQNWDELVQYQMDQFGYTREQAEEEVICNTAPAMLEDERNVLKLYKGNRKLFERVVDWVKGMLKDIKAAGKALSTRSKSWAQMDALAKDRKALQEMYDRMMAVMEKPAEKVADNHVVKMSQQESHYDYSKPFAEQIDDWLDGNFPKGDTFLVSSTPDVLQKIGFSKLPMSYDQKHMRQVLGNPKNRDHDLGVDFMKALPEMIADPVAIVTAPKNDGSIMMVLAHQNKNANDRPVVGIVRVEKGGAYNKIYVDANKLETAHSRGDLDEIITAAVEQEKAGGVGVYYVAEKKSLHSVLEHGQSQVLDSLNRTGYIHSIHDTGSNVKAELMDQTESRQFKRWFGDSKVVNEDGSPKLMYRGGNEDIEIFDRRKSKASNLYGRGFYFTESEEHAKQYGGVNSYYLRIEHPLDASSGDKQINQSQMRNFLEAVAEDEDYGLENYGYGATVDSVLRSLRGKDDFAALQDINATAVGDFVAAIELFNEVNGTKYDGIITPTETVVFDSRQIKSATDNAGTFDPENPNVKYSMQEPVEETRDLLAVHNLTAENLQNILELGGLAMPSIAVIKAEQGHSMYGPISVIFDKSTIDPKASRDNEIYGGDAWTPTFPQIEYEVDEAVESRIFEKYRKLRGKVGDQISRVMYRYAGDLAGEVGKHDGVEKIIEKMKTNTDMMQMYLADKGEEPLEPVKKTIIKRTGKIQAEQYESLIQKMGVDVMRSFETPEGEKIGEHRRAWMNEHREALQRAYVEILADATGLPEENVAALAENKQNLNRMVLDAYNYMKTGGETREEVIDYEATEKAIRDAVDEKGYEKWLNDLFDGAVKRKGIRNNTDTFTPSGKRRSFAQTHWDVTLDNVVRAMRSEEKTGVGMGGRNIEGAAVKKYRTIKEVKADSNRLRTIDQDEYNAKRQEFQKRFSEIAYEYAAGKDQFDAGDALVEFITQNATADGIYRLMEKEAAFYKPSRKVAEELAELVEEMKNVPTGYFEAKPRRAIGFDEVAALVVPNDLNEEMRTELEKRGVNMVEYEAGNEADRLAKMNSNNVSQLRFSMRETDENVQDAMSAEEKAYAQVKGHRITAAEADKLAGEMLKLANSDYDHQKAASRLSRTIDYIERGEDVDWNQVDDELTSLAADVMSKSRTLDMEHEEMAKPIRDYLRTTRIRLTESQRAEAESLAGTYGAYRKNLFGRVRLTSTGGTPLDSLWSELTAMNPELFPADAAEGEMAVLLTNAVDALKPVYHSGMGMNMEESANWLAGKVHEAYLSLPTVKAAAKNAKTFGESIVALKNAMKRFEETSWTEYQSALREIRAARGAQKRTQQQEETEALRKKYVQWREKDTAQRKERELKRKYRARIERTAAALTNWMMKPTDAKHVPAGVEDSVRRMLETLDFSGKTTKTAADLCERLDGLADAIANAQEKEDGNQTMFLERDQQMIDEIKLVAERIRGNTSHQQREGRGVYDLNGMELRELSKWLDVVRHNVTEASKLRGSNLPGESVEQVASMSIAEMSRKKPQKDKKWATKQWNQLFGPDMQDSFTFFERMGPTANAIFRELRSGFDKVTQLTRQAEVHTKRILEGANLKEMTGKAAKKREFVLHSGRVEMTRAQIMELYVLSKREQAQGHIYGEGIKIQGDEDARPHAITKAEVKTITDSLSEDEKRIADGLQRFLSKECAGWGNETSMKLLGYRKFGEENYWPIRTDSNSRNTTRLEDNYAANISAIKNQGMTKATIEGAKNAIVIGDIFDSYTRHISNMAAYSGYALPLSDFTRWYNTRGVKTEVEQMMGQKGLKYINNFLMAVNGSALREEQGGLEKMAGTFSRNAKVASVGANARVVIQQPTSYARAAMYMSPKYLSKALAMRKPKEDLVNRYCGIAQWKRWGFYETNIGPNLRQMLVGDETAADKLREIAMMPAAMGDDWTLNHLWNACELETRDMYPEMVRGSEEYYQQVGKRMSEIIDRTQVVDSVFHRSQMMRSKNAMAQMLTNFMSEPTKTYNMLMSAISDYADNRRNKAARNRVARAFAVYGVTGLMTAAAAAVVDAFRDDDEEKEWAEKYLNAVGDNAKDNLNPLGLLPGVKDVLSLLEGYEPSRLDTQSIQRIIWAAEEIKKYAEGESRQNLYGVTYKTAQALSSMLGIPVSNLMRDLNAVVQTVTGSNITLNAEARKNSTANRLYDALEAGDAKKAKELRESLSTKVGMTPKEIDTAIAQRLVENPKIAEAWNAKQNRDYAAMNRIKNAMTAQGYGSEAFDKAVSLYDNAQKPKEEKTKDPNEQLQAAMYTEADVVSAVRILAGVETGGSITEDDVRAMMSERMGDSKAEDPEASVISGIQSELKKDYLAAEAKGDAAAMKRLGMVMQNLLGTKQDTMDGWVKTQHANNLRNAVDQNNQKAAANAVKVMRADGKTDSEIKSSLSKYKQLYIDAVNARDTKKANQIKTMLKSLGLKGKNGDSLYTDKHFADWLK